MKTPPNGRKRRRNSGAWLYLAIASVCLCLHAPPLAAQESGRVQRGRTFAQANCSGCHAVGRVGASPLRIAPPFRDLHKRYPVEDLAEALSEGITTGHPSMPEFQLDVGQIGDLIAFLKTFER